MHAIARPLIALGLTLCLLSPCAGAMASDDFLVQGQETDDLLTEALMEDEVLPDEEETLPASPGTAPGDTVIPPQWPVPDYVTWLLQQAGDEVGYTEGYAGFTKYGQWSGDPLTQWCAEYLCWCVQQVDIHHGTRLLKNTYPLYTSSNTGRSWFIRQGRYIVRQGYLDGWGYQWLKGHTEWIKTGSYIPQPGDWVFFTWRSGTDTDHVAMVEYCTRDSQGKITIHVLEGNNPDQVQRNTYALTNKQILGYGTVHDVMDVTMRSGNSGIKVAKLQEKLAYLKLMDAEKADGVYGDATTAAVRLFQESHHLKPSGIANQKTQMTLEMVYRKAMENDPAMWMVVDEDPPAP